MPSSTSRRNKATAAGHRRGRAHISATEPPRRTPTQVRAAVTVEAILEAARELIARDGFKSLSTNTVARRAGVSVGSLYQYFPNKTSILGALIERHVAEVEPAIDHSLDELADPTIPYAVALRRLFGRLIDLHRAHPHLHDMLIGDAPPDVLALRREREQDYVARTAAIFRARADVTVKNVLAAAQVTVLTAEALSHFLVHSAPPDLDREAFVDEAVQLLASYAAPPR
jgi:AcrR family transcriptional regulator